MDMQFEKIFKREDRKPAIIAGPCSAETEEQVLATAHALKDQNIDLFRSGIWKPRTRPNTFEGVGKPGLVWLRKVKEETGLKVTTEVANKEHVYESLKYGVDVLWIGARTTVNPFAVQDIADALEGVDIPVMIKNPINPDLNLWIGAIERIYNIGIRKIAAIHRGFSSFGDSHYRNIPLWQIPIELKRRFPDLEVICDNSHICGRRDILQEVAQQAMNLSFDGLMTEVHPNPDEAWSDAKQQLTPPNFQKLVDDLIIREGGSAEVQDSLAELRLQIDQVDNELLDILSKRMGVAKSIGQYKKENNVPILQPARWSKILDKSAKKGEGKGLSEEFIVQLFRAIHQESINQQNEVMNS
jgi:chorismate mutase